MAQTPGVRHGFTSDYLVSAIRKNNVAKLQKKLEEMPRREAFTGAVFNVPGNVNKGHLPMTSLSLMHIAALFDALDCFICLETSFDLKYDEESADSYRPIHYACYNGSYEVVCYIIAKDPLQARLLPAVEHHLIYLATVSGNADILELILANGADVLAHENVKDKPVEQAIKRRHVECLKLLLKNKLVKTRDVREYSTLMMAIANLERDAVPMLLEYGEDPNYITNKDHHSALFLACFLGKEWLDTVKLLCEKATKIDLDPGINDKAAIHWACSSKSPEILGVILDKGVDVNRLDKNGHTGLHYLLDSCDEETTIKMMEMMVQNGLTLDGPNLSIIVDFITAIKKPCKVIAWLFAHGVNPLATYQGKTIAQYVQAVARTNRNMRQIFRDWCEPALKKQPQ